MEEYLDFNINIEDMLGAIEPEREQTNESEYKGNRRLPIDADAFLRVRNSVCVAGYHWETVNEIKRSVGTLLDEPFPIEGFHVKSPGDVKDGALLVPKIMLVARHCPGLKLIDDEEDRGQLDLIYDEVCEMEADVMIIYVGLPRSIYKPMRHMVYHPKTADTLFPNQPILRSLAADNCFITITEKCDLTNMQKNVIREWLTKPVQSDHPVFKVADYLSSVEVSTHDCDGGYGSSSARMQVYRPPSNSADHDPYSVQPDVHFQPATEEHPLAEKKKKKKRKDKKDKRSSKAVVTKRNRDMGTLHETADEGEAGVEMDTMRFNYDNKAHSFDDFV